MSKDLQKVLLTAPKYGHEIIFATARSYRDCLSVLEGELRQLTVVSLNGGEVFQDERLVSQYRIPSSALRTIVSYCDIYNLPYLLMIPLIMLFKILSKSLFFQMLIH
ncbi:HAD hydrolase family protein [Streptococcus thermophilus]